MEQLDSLTLNGSSHDRSNVGRLMEPVFVLCMGRSGSTLLRLILDTHPDLACPPETNIPALCSQLAVVWSLIEGAPLALQRGDEPPTIPDTAIAGIRHTMDMMTTPYLDRRGKKVYCDKSLGTARYAELLVRIYPGTRFICLFRHPMDMISSGLEACPWGLNGYGFDQYIADSPGNAVMALARYWHDRAHEIAAVEEQYSERCYRVRYEDMVRDPERIAAGIFDFIGVRPVTGIAQAVFSKEHERFGPADHKIWHTSKISPDSIGRSDSVPIGLIPPPILESINGLLDNLGYVRADEKWGTPGMPADMLMSAGKDVKIPNQGGALPEVTILADRLEAGLARIDNDFAARWEARMAEIFMVAVRQPNGAGSLRWHVNLGRHGPASGVKLEPAGPDSSEEDSEGADWSIVGTAQAWLEVLSERLNLSVALRQGVLRYCDLDENDGFVTEARVAMLAALLALPSWADNPAIAIEQVPAMAD